MSEDARALSLAFVTNLYPPYVVGGNELLARDVVEALRARGHAVHVLTGRGSRLVRDGFTHSALTLDLDRKEDVFLGAAPVTLRRALAWHLYDPASARAVAGALRRLRPELVVAWNLYGASLAPLAAARGAGFRTVAQPADRWLLNGLYDLPAALPEPARTPLVRLAGRLAQPLLRRRAQPGHLLAVSERVRGWHTERGFPEARSRATHLGVPVGLFPAPARSFPQGRPWRLVFAGQLWEGKGPQVAVEVARRLAVRRDLPRAELSLYGDGASGFLEHLRGVIAASGVADRVRLAGFVPRERLARAFREHDVFLFCSIWDEPFSGGLLEALCAGLPTVATSAGGTPEAVRDGDNGLLVPPGDAEAATAAVARLMREPALYAGLAARAAADVRARWGFEQYVSRLERCYRSIRDGAGLG